MARLLAMEFVELPAFFKMKKGLESEMKTKYQAKTKRILAIL